MEPKTHFPIIACKEDRLELTGDAQACVFHPNNDMCYLHTECIHNQTLNNSQMLLGRIDKKNVEAWLRGNVRTEVCACYRKYGLFVCKKHAKGSNLCDTTYADLSQAIQIAEQAFFYACLCDTFPHYVMRGQKPSPDRKDFLSVEVYKLAHILSKFCYAINCIEDVIEHIRCATHCIICELRTYVIPFAHYAMDQYNRFIQRLEEDYIHVTIGDFPETKKAGYKVDGIWFCILGDEREFLYCFGTNVKFRLGFIEALHKRVITPLSKMLNNFFELGVTNLSCRPEAGLEDKWIEKFQKRYRYMICHHYCGQPQSKQCCLACITDTYQKHVQPELEFVIDFRPGGLLSLAFGYTLEIVDQPWVLDVDNELCVTYSIGDTTSVKDWIQ